MFSFAKTLQSKSKQAEYSFLKLVIDSNHSYSTILLNQSYDLKKAHFKVANLIGTRVPYNKIKKFDDLRTDYGYKVAQFNLLLSYVHLFFTVALNFRLFKNYDSSSLSFGQILMHDSFKALFDSHEQLIFRRFNIVRNIIAHSASADLFNLLDDEDFHDLHLLIKSLTFLESEFLDFMRKNSFFENTENFWDLFNNPCRDEHFPFIKSLLHDKDSKNV